MNFTARTPSILENMGESISRFSAYRSIPPDRSTLSKEQKKRAAEAMDLAPFLKTLQEIVTIDDVESAVPPEPDFIFTIEKRRIGAEMTIVNPALFGPGGNKMLAKYKEWQEMVNDQPSGKYTFPFGSFSLRESLASLRAQVQSKNTKAMPWKDSFAERWLIMHVTTGSPFGILVATRVHLIKPEAAEHVDDVRAKTLFEVCEIFREPTVFDAIFLFSGRQLIAFRKDKNPYRFPMPRWDIVAHGGRAPDAILDLQSKINHTVEKNGDARSFTTRSD